MMWPRVLPVGAYIGGIRLADGVHIVIGNIIKLWGGTRALLRVVV